MQKIIKESRFYYIIGIFFANAKNSYQKEYKKRFLYRGKALSQLNFLSVVLTE